MDALRQRHQFVESAVAAEAFIALQRAAPAADTVQLCGQPAEGRQILDAPGIGDRRQIGHGGAGQQGVADRPQHRPAQGDGGEPPLVLVEPAEQRGRQQRRGQPVALHRCRRGDHASCHRAIGNGVARQQRPTQVTDRGRHCRRAGRHGGEALPRRDRQDRRGRSQRGLRHPAAATALQECGFGRSSISRLGEGAAGQQVARESRAATAGGRGAGAGQGDAAQREGVSIPISAPTQCAVEEERQRVPQRIQRRGKQRQAHACGPGGEGVGLQQRQVRLDGIERLAHPAGFEGQQPVMWAGPTQHAVQHGCGNCGAEVAEAVQGLRPHHRDMHRADHAETVADRLQPRAQGLRPLCQRLAWSLTFRRGAQLVGADHQQDTVQRPTHRAFAHGRHQGRPGGVELGTVGGIGAGMQDRRPFAEPPAAVLGAAVLGPADMGRVGGEQRRAADTEGEEPGNVAAPQGTAHLPGEDVHSFAVGARQRRLAGGGLRRRRRLRPHMQGRGRYGLACRRLGANRGFGGGFASTAQPAAQLRPDRPCRAVQDVERQRRQRVGQEGEDEGQDPADGRTDGGKHQLQREDQ